MARNMSFALTTEQVRNKTKTVTRRFAWWNLSAGVKIQPVEKCMGFNRGEHIKKIGGLIEIVSVRSELLNQITQNDVIKEGFPDWGTTKFIKFICDHYKIKDDVIINRIEFKYL